MKVLAENLLRDVYGENAQFHAGQWEAIEALIQQRQRVLVVQRTGWGKSLVYFLSTRIIREADGGMTIIVSPLLSLIRNQLQSAALWSLRAVSINSTNYDDHARIEGDILNDDIDLLMISPERLANERFQREVWDKIKSKIGLLVIDEAHCISDWGHDFRPDYRRLMRILEELPPQTPVLGTTATANNRVIQDVSAILGAGMNILRGSLTRESLMLYVYPEPLDHAERLVLLSHLMRSIPGCGIIYCTTTRDCITVARWLSAEGFNVKPYYASVDQELGESRVDLENQLLNNQLKALVSSVALGMGFDKPDLHFVVHYQQPGNLIGYYQQIGRAGRGIDNAHIVLMHGPGDDDIQRYFIDTAFPKPEQVEKSIEAFQQNGAMTMKELQPYINVRQSVLEKILTHLEVEKIIVRQDSAYHLVDAQTLPDFERWGHITRQRYDELAQMHRYIDHKQCLMRFIAETLDDPTVVQPCGRCKNCRGSQSRFIPTPDALGRAQTFLRDAEPILIEPRKQWVKGAAGKTAVKMTPVNEIGVALCNYHASGWGSLVREGRERNTPYSDALVEAAAQAIRRHWRSIDQRPVWVTSVPSLRRPQLVPTFAQRLAVALHLPYAPVVQQTRQHPPQAEMHNSHQQVENVWNVFAVQGAIRAEPVLLVDDLADSRWTLTVVGDVLRRAGSGSVHPFALAAMS